MVSFFLIHIYTRILDLALRESILGWVPHLLTIAPIPMSHPSLPGLFAKTRNSVLWLISVLSNCADVRSLSNSAFLSFGAYLYAGREGEGLREGDMWDETQEWRWGRCMSTFLRTDPAVGKNFCLRAIPYIYIYDVRSGWGRWVPKKQTKGTKSSDL